MRKLLLVFLLLYTQILSAQNINAIINKNEVERIETILSSDEMQGRKTFTPGIDKAAAFIASEFSKAGIKPLNGAKDFMQSFSLVSPKPLSLECSINGKPVDEKHVMIVTTVPKLDITENSGFEMVQIPAGASLFSMASQYIHSGKNYLVLVDPSFQKDFSRLAYFRQQLFPSNSSVVFIVGKELPGMYSLKAEHTIVEQKLANVAGMIPGKSKKNEFVIFSAHYDHLGIGKPVNGDSIYNGANDDAAGVTAVILLSKYFKALGNNERSLIFVTFTAEEIGGFGSQYFSRQLNPDQVAAMFNIEMIGTDSKWGKNSAFITGYGKTDMGEILEKNLKGSGFKFYPDPYTAEQLFYRSDNATLARLGVPAHTISTSKMDNEPNYHQPSDEVQTLDLANMTEIIKAIAISSKGIVEGKDTPSRVDTKSLR